MALQAAQNMAVEGVGVVPTATGISIDQVRTQMESSEQRQQVQEEMAVHSAVSVMVV
jgi:hypothetical protein